MPVRETVRWLSMQLSDTVEIERTMISFQDSRLAISTLQSTSCTAGIGRLTNRGKRKRRSSTLPCLFWARGNSSWVAVPLFCCARVPRHPSHLHRENADRKFKVVKRSVKWLLVPIRVFRNSVVSSSRCSALLLILRAKHQLWADEFVKIFLTKGIKCHSTLFQSQPFLMCILGNLRSHIVPDDRIQACDEHKTAYG